MISRFLALCPRIYVEQERFVAVCPWRLRIGLAGSYYRQVVVDPTTRIVTLSWRYLWLIGGWVEYPFDRIEAVTYGYNNAALGAGMATAQDSFDWFTVGLRLHGEEDEVTLFDFIGEGTFTNNSQFPDWWYWRETAFDMAGTQENESRRFADILAKLVSAPVQPPSDY